MVWNINGLGSKLESGDLQEYLKQYDIIFLSETWLTQHQLNINEIYFDNYEIVNAVRQKVHKKAKRGSGGLTIMYNPDTITVNVVETKCDHFIVIEDNNTVKSESITVISAYVPPKDTTYVCSTCSNDYFDQLSLLVAKYRNNNLVIVGDMNARTGLLKDYYTSCEGSQRK